MKGKQQASFSSHAQASAYAMARREASTMKQPAQIAFAALSL